MPHNLKNEHPSEIETLRRAYEGRSESARTRTLVKSVLAAYEHYLGGLNESFATATVEHVQKWRDAMLEGRRPFTRKLAPATVALRLSVIRTFHQRLVEAGACASNPATTGLVSPPELPEQHRTVALSAKQIRTLLAAPDRDSVRGARDAAVLHLLAYLGLRRAEICSLRIRDIVHLNARTPDGADIPWGIRVKVKGGRERLLPLPGKCKRVIDRYLSLDADDRKTLRANLADSPLIQATGYDRMQHPGKLSSETIRLIVKRYAEYCGFLQPKPKGKRKNGNAAEKTAIRISPHVFRHTAITRALDKGISYRDIQAMTGHRNISTVQRYDSNKFSVEHNAVNRLDYDD
jgi:site-specific recombinase XerD